MARKNAKSELDEKKVLAALKKREGLTVSEVIDKLQLPGYRDLEVRRILHSLAKSGKAKAQTREMKGGFIGRRPMEYRAS